ncbi:MAG: S53 family peptidase [Deltaproteobacteria bacterium]|nr:S53 family peptidase [Deltaproteobacteria bacterium]
MGNSAEKFVAISALLLAACITEPASEKTSSASSELKTEAVCSGGRLHCMSRRVLSDVGSLQITADASSGLGPSDLASAYAIPTTVDPGATIAIVDAYGYSNIESDLAAYRSHYGLPACTIANGCLKVVNQNGQTSPLPSDPPANDDWTVETALDIDMASAGCPKCKILVVQADNDQGNGLSVANNAAAALGATVISNSWGAPESQFSFPSDDSYFNHPGVGVFVSSGDSGYDTGGQGPAFPATSAYVISVGGTNLQKTGGSRGWSETAWSSGGSSCSQSIAKPSWQTSTACSMRISADVSAVGDPATGVAVYNGGGFQVVGGTSAASPLVAAIFAVTKNGSVTSQFAYQHTTAFNDVTSGHNGSCGTVVCNAGAGWDGPTGVGTPIGSTLATLGGGGGGGGGSGSGSGTGGGGGGSGSGTGGGGSGGGGGGGGSGSGSDGGGTGGGGGGAGGGGGGGGGNGSNADNGPETGGCAAAGGTSLIPIAFAMMLRRRRRSR